MIEKLKSPTKKQKYTLNLPYRCLLPQTVEGLMTAGRSVSASHIADFYTGNMVACIGSGQAAGTAAALCARKGILPKQLKVPELADTLNQQGPLDFRATQP